MTDFFFLVRMCMGLVTDRDLMRRNELAEYEKYLNNAIARLNKIPFAQQTLHERFESEDLESERADTIRKAASLDSAIALDFTAGARKMRADDSPAAPSNDRRAPHTTPACA